MKVASFFSGIGGFDLGFERAGMKVVFQSEINNFCRKVLKKHWPDVKLAGDINNLNAHDIPKADLWCGGFPCQDVSLANQGKRKGLNGDRSGLFFKFAELIEEKKPKWIVVENVPGLLNSNMGEDFKVVIKTLDELGYISAWRILDAKYFGTPQRRRRIYIVSSYRKDSSTRVLFDRRTIENVPEKGKNKEGFPSPQNGFQDENASLFAIQHACIGRKPEAGPQSKGWRSDGETWTLDSRGSADVVCTTTNPFRMRKTSRLSKRMDGNRYRAIGNAVSVPVVEWLGKQIVKVEKKDRRLSVNRESYGR